MTKQTKARQERLEKRVNERQVYWNAKRPFWTKLPVAHVEKPLRFIKERCTIEKRDEEGNKSYEILPIYYMARDFAKIGDGHAVQVIARTLINSVGDSE